MDLIKITMSISSIIKAVTILFGGLTEVISWLGRTYVEPGPTAPAPFGTELSYTGTSTNPGAAFTGIAHLVFALVLTSSDSQEFIISLDSQE